MREETENSMKTENCKGKKNCKSVCLMGVVRPFESEQVKPARNEATEPPIVLAILSTLWPALQSAAYLYPTSERVVEKLCRLLKHAMRAAKPEELASLVEPLLDVVVGAYSRSPMSPYMYAAGIAVDPSGSS